MGDKPTIYIAGPMTGIHQYNYPAFAEAKAHLTALGWDARSPHESEVDDNGVPGSVPYEVYFKAGLKLMLQCENIALLPGWTASRGAVKEILVALSCGMEAYMYYAGREKRPLRPTDEKEIWESGLAWPR